MPRLDWYQSTIDAYPRVIVDALMELPGAYDLRHGRGRLNYRESSSVLTVDGDVLATVLHGGHNGAPNAVATGEAAGPFADIIRRCWPDAHRVTRMDSAEDVRMDFDAAQAACKAIADEMRIKGRAIVPDDPEDGATYYMGSESSRVRFRCYEKGKQLRAEGVADADPDIVRFELQLRPSDRQARVMAASLSPEAVWGATAWARRVASVFEHNPEPVVMRHRLKSTYERRHAAMLVQYGGHLREMLARHGSWELVGEQLGVDLELDSPEA